MFLCVPVCFLGVVFLCVSFFGRDGSVCIGYWNWKGLVIGFGSGMDWLLKLDWNWLWKTRIGWDRWMDGYGLDRAFCMLDSLGLGVHARKGNCGHDRSRV